MCRKRGEEMKEAMAKTIEISDAAYAAIMTHARANGESSIRAVDELVDGADKVWNMWMPEMKTVWTQFQEYWERQPAFENMPK